MKKENFLSKIFNGIKKILERINQVDVEDSVAILTKEEKAEYENAIKVQNEVKKQRSFVQKVNPDPLMKKYGEPKEGNPIYDVAHKMRIDEEEEKEDDELTK